MKSLNSKQTISETEAYDIIKRAAFADNHGEPFCPECGTVEPYFVSTRRKWKCRACGKSFSATSGTIFASRKMSFKKYAMGLMLLTNTPKSKSSIHLADALGIQQRAAYAFAKKVRDGMLSDRPDPFLRRVMEGLHNRG